MNKRFNSMQGGFTLIELIVVIVILGILAATALPKFAGLSGDARVASLQAVKGSLSSVSAMLHGRALIKPTETEFEVEGGTKVPMVHGYPAAGPELFAAAGLSGDYDIQDNDHWIRITPKNLPTGMAETCYAYYTQPASAGAAPVIAVVEAEKLKCE